MTQHILPPDFAPRLAPRMTPGRKAEVCRLVLDREATFDEVAARHQLSADELRGWLERYQRHGVRGLSVTRLQQVRHG